MILGSIEPAILLKYWERVIIKENKRLTALPLDYAGNAISLVFLRLDCDLFDFYSQKLRRPTATNQYWNPLAFG